ncbi:Voltage gated chloride channel [Gracilaria domingensis]|nr:Voltage gated chloride channel [Gracilaria domingensis]
MSQSWNTGSPRLARQSRSKALLEGVNLSVSDAPETAPQWLISEQKQFIRNGGNKKPPPTTRKPRSSDHSKSKQRQKENQDDDFIIVDLLDGAHVSTKPAQPSNKQSDQMTSNSDSIISLPPIDAQTAPQWSALESEAREARRLHRARASMGSYVPPSVFNKMNKHFPLPDVPQRQRVPVFNNFEAKESKMTPADTVSAPLSAMSSRPEQTPLVSSRQHRRQPSLTNTQPEALSVPSQSRDAPLARHEYKKEHSRRNSFMTGSFWDEEFGHALSVKSSERSKSQGKKKAKRRRENFEPGAWGWRKPAEEDAIMPSGAWVYLALIGFCTFTIALIINTTAKFLSGTIISGLASVFGNAYGDRAGVFALAGLRGLSLAASFLVVLKIAPYYSAGSGIPEMKCVLSGVLLRKMLNWRTLLSKSIGLIFSLSSEISIGRLGPFIHISGITAALVSKIPWFESLSNSARFQLQALNAAMAAGVGATFGAPIGGTMLAIEIMSTYYYIHWLPMALYCSIMGYYFVVAFGQADSTAYFTSNVTLHLKDHSIQRLLTYVVLGALCGLVGAALVEFTKMAFQFRRSYFKNSTPVRTTLMVIVFAMLHTFVSFWVGGVLAVGQKEGVTQLFNKTAGKDLWVTEIWEPFSSDHLNTCFALIIATTVKFFLTGLSLVMPVPAGTFMPIFEIGALVGRAFGEFASGIWFVNWVDVRTTAIIGAAAVTAGTLHTTAVAVVMLELTREAIDVLPLAVGVIVSYGVSKHMCSDLFSELIKLRRLPFILGLRERYPSENKQFFEDAASVTAKSCMTRDFPYVTPESTKGEVYRMLTQGGKPWTTCAFLSDRDRRRLWGTVSQKALWDAIGDDFGQYYPGCADENAYGTFDAEFSRENELIPFLRDFDPEVGHEYVDMGPMQISVNTPFWRIITYFRMLSMNTTYVVQDGVTVGIVSRVQVIQYSIQLEERARRKRAQEKESQTRREQEEARMLEQFRRNPIGVRMASRASFSDLPSNSSGGRKSRHSSSRFR